MSQRDLIVLGSASQVPTRYRNHNGYLLRWAGHGVLFDPGEGTQRQMTMFGVPTGAIHRICITHFHGDHCLGLPGILQRLSLDGVHRPTKVHYPASGEAYFNRLRHASIYEERAEIVPSPVKDADRVLLDRWGQTTLSAFRLDHRCDAFGYRIQDADRRSFDRTKLDEAGIRGPMVRQLERDGFAVVNDRKVRVEDVSVPRKGASAAFIMDTRLCDALVDLASGVDLMICESTYLHKDRDLAQKNGHLTALQAAEVAHSAGVGHLVLTHFSRRYPRVQDFLEEARTVFPGTSIASDGMRIGIDGQTTSSVSLGSTTI